MAQPIPLIGAPQQPPQFPQTGINVNPDGMQVTIVLAPGMSFLLSYGPDVMDGITKTWKEERRKHEAIMHMVESTKNNGKG
jgi:hypothetical protein